MKAIKGTIPAMRPVNASMAALAALTGAVVELGPVSSSRLFQILLLSLTALFTVGGANILNDLNDRRIDRKIHPGRIIASGRFSTSDARISLIVLFSISILFTALVSIMEFNPLPIFLLLTSILLVVLYEFHLKKRGIPGNIIIGLLSGMIFIFGGSLWGPGSLLLLLGAMAMISTITREIIKDIQDEHGERKERRTLPMVIGRKMSFRIAGSALLLAAGISIVPIFLFSISLFYIIPVLLADVIMILGLFHSRNDVKNGQNIIKIGMFIAMIGFFLSAIV